MAEDEKKLSRLAANGHKPLPKPFLVYIMHICSAVRKPNPTWEPAWQVGSVEPFVLSSAAAWKKNAKPCHSLPEELDCPPWVLLLRLGEAFDACSEFLAKTNESKAARPQAGLFLGPSALAFCMKTAWVRKHGRSKPASPVQLSRNLTQSRSSKMTELEISRARAARASLAFRCCDGFRISRRLRLRLQRGHHPLLRGCCIVLQDEQHKLHWSLVPASCKQLAEEDGAHLAKAPGGSASRHATPDMWLILRDPCQSVESFHGLLILGHQDVAPCIGRLGQRRDL